MNDTAIQLDLEHAELLATGLAGTLAARRIYAPGHSRIEGAIRGFLGSLKAVTAAGEQFRVTTAAGLLTYAGVPLCAGHGSVRQLAGLLASRKVGGIEFGAAVGPDSLRSFIEWVVDGNPRPADECNWAGITLLADGAGEGGDDEQARRVVESFREFGVAQQVREASVEVIEHVLDDVRLGRDVDFREIVELTQWVAEAAHSEGTRLVATTQRIMGDAYTLNHSVNVFLISTSLLQPFARDRKQLARFSQAALLHDVGKTLVPREILYKQGKLTDEEFEQVKLHPELGAEILARNPHIDPLSIEVAYCHHMRENGHGYPTPSLPIRPGPVSRIVQVSDMFEALTAHRPYKEGMSAERAVRTIGSMKGMEARQDALATLIRRLTISPPGSEVSLHTGERGVVIEAYPDAPHHPRVRIMTDESGRTLASPLDLDLRDRIEEDDRPIDKVHLKPGMVRTGREAAAASLTVR